MFVGSKKTIRLKCRVHFVDSGETFIAILHVDEGVKSLDGLLYTDIIVREALRKVEKLRPLGEGKVDTLETWSKSPRDMNIALVWRCDENNRLETIEIQVHEEKQ